jgi:hypothetical protein
VSELGDLMEHVMREKESELGRILSILIHRMEKYPGKDLS